MAPFLNYAQQGFNYLGGAAVSPPPGVVPPPPPPLSYGELPPCPEGFTRSPRETDYLVCPRCQRELCTSEQESDDPASSGSAKGKGKKTKRVEKAEDGREELWVVRACEHVSHFRPQLSSTSTEAQSGPCQQILTPTYRSTAVPALEADLPKHQAKSRQP